MVWPIMGKQWRNLRWGCPASQRRAKSEGLFNLRQRERFVKIASAEQSHTGSCGRRYRVNADEGYNPANLCCWPQAQNSGRMRSTPRSARAGWVKYTVRKIRAWVAEW